LEREGEPHPSFSLENEEKRGEKKSISLFQIVCGQKQFSLPQRLSGNHRAQEKERGKLDSAMSLTEREGKKKTKKRGIAELG